MVEGADQVGEDWQGLSFLGKLVRCQCVFVHVCTEQHDLRNVIKGIVDQAASNSDLHVSVSISSHRGTIVKVMTWESWVLQTQQNGNRTPLYVKYVLIHGGTGARANQREGILAKSSWSNCFQCQ